MAMFKRKDPAADAYRKMSEDKATKKQYDFIGYDAKIDGPIKDQEKYRKSEEKACKTLGINPLHEDKYGYIDDTDAHDMEFMNTPKNQNIPEKISYIRRKIVGARHRTGEFIDEAILPHEEKHRLAKEFMHHDSEADPTDDDFHKTKTPFDRVLEEMTKQPLDEEKKENIRRAIDEFGDRKNSYRNAEKGVYDSSTYHKYLKNKYRFALNDEPKPMKEYSPEENLLSHEEYEKHADKWHFTHNRIAEELHPKGGNRRSVWEDNPIYQIHPNGDINRVSNFVRMSHAAKDESFNKFALMNEDDHNSVNFHHNNLNELHTSHIHADPNLHHAVEEYTSDSSTLNYYLGHGSVKSYSKQSDSQLDEMDDSLTRGMRESPPYAHKLKVWTGLHTETDLGKFARQNRDEKEKLVGHLPTYISTSLHPKQAMDFSRARSYAGRQDVHDLMRIDIPKAYHKGLYVAGASFHPGEYEYLLHKGHDIEVHPKPIYYANGGSMYRVWKARPILHDEDREELANRAKESRET